MLYFRIALSNRYYIGESVITILNVIKLAKRLEINLSVYNIVTNENIFFLKHHKFDVEKIT